MKHSESDLDTILQDLGRLELSLEQAATKYLALSKTAHKHGETGLGEEMYLAHKAALDQRNALAPQIRDIEAKLYAMRRNKSRDRLF